MLCAVDRRPYAPRIPLRSASIVVPLTTLLSSLAGPAAATCVPFSTPQTINGNFDAAESVCAADLDGDGDVDVLGAASRADDVKWWENPGGHFTLPTTNTAPTMLEAGDAASLLTITLAHRGRSGDSDEELATLELRFDDGASAPLASAEADALINYRLEGSGAFDASSDTLVATVWAFALTDGLETVSFTDGDPDVRPSYGRLQRPPRGSLCPGSASQLL